MIKWNKLESVAQLEDIIRRSEEVPCAIFKHSTRCSISSLAKRRLEDDWDFPQAELEPYFLDLLRHRDISAQIAETFSVHHESPQILLIKNGECYYDSSHLNINMSELHEVYE